MAKPAARHPIRITWVPTFPKTQEHTIAGYVA